MHRIDIFQPNGKSFNIKLWSNFLEDVKYTKTLWKNESDRLLADTLHIMLDARYEAVYHTLNGGAYIEFKTNERMVEFLLRYS